MARIDQLKALKDTVAIVGIGDTDYLSDYRSGAKGNTSERGSGALDAYGLAAKALRRALEDSGLQKSAIDGISVSGMLEESRTAEVLGLDPAWCHSASMASDAVIEAVQAINAGLCDTVLCLYGTAQRSANVQYGGPQASGQLSYSFYAPWGMTSQGGLYAMAFRRHQLMYGTTEEQLGAVAVTLRKHAQLNPNAIMYGKPLTLEDYLQSRYVARPLRLFDYCLVNDGGVALILQRADMAKDAAQTPISISGFGWREADRENTQLRPRLKDFYHSAHHGVRDQVYPMSGLGPKDIDVYSTYDSFSTHVLLTLEGFGFCGEGESGAFIQDGRIGIGGELPVNTSGGMMSESYMQSWNHQVELVRQLRHTYEGGPRQVANAEVGQYVFDGSGRCHSVIYTREN